MSLIALSNVGKRFGGDEILRDVSFRLERGDRVALVGSNGAGKSTLLRIIAGLEEPDSGTVTRSRGLRIAYLPQEPELRGSDTVYEAMLEMFREVIAAQERLRELEGAMASGDSAAVEEYGRLQAVVEHAGYDYRGRIERVLTGLGLERALWYQPVDTLSGGQRTRLNLARTLLEDADLLLLDEPTNHLDIAALEWLEAYLKDLPRAFLIVAHDRYLLDRVTRRTLDLARGRVTSYDAPYERYLQLKAERMERQRDEYEAQQRHIAKTEEFVRRYGAGQRSKEARGRRKRLERMDRIERPEEEDSVHLGLNGAGRSGDVVLTANRLVAGYPDRPLVELPDQLVVQRGQRIAVVGPNGTGKTTLLRTLIGALEPLQGEVRWGSRTGIGYYSQSLETLDDRRTVLEEVTSVRPMSEEEARGYLGRFLFTADDVFKTVAVLSGGEKSRVALAKLILQEPNVLVLDEPTNHLDIASREALRRVLADFPGTLLFVSHDRYLIDSLAQQLWVVEDGRLTRFAGGYTAYASGSGQPLDAPRKPLRLTTPERRRELEDQAEALAGRLAEISRTSALTQLSDLMDRYAEAVSALEEADEAWLEALRRDLRASSV